MENGPLYPRRRAMWPWVVGALVVMVLGLCTIGALALGIGASDGSVSILVPSTHPTPPQGSRAVPVRPAIKGDDVVHVGEDVRAGTYRAVTAIPAGSTCYWAKSSDAEGKNILDNGLPTGGRPQVTLKKGEWFTSQGCPDWAAR